jgi:hypothetical protein
VGLDLEGGDVSSGLAGEEDQGPVGGAERRLVNRTRFKIGPLC